MLKLFCAIHIAYDLIYSCLRRQQKGENGGTEKTRSLNIFDSSNDPINPSEYKGLDKARRKNAEPSKSNGSSAGGLGKGQGKKDDPAESDDVSASGLDEGQEKGQGKDHGKVHGKLDKGQGKGKGKVRGRMGRESSSALKPPSAKHFVKKNPTAKPTLDSVSMVKFQVENLTLPFRFASLCRL